MWKKRARETTPIYGFIAFCCSRKYFHWLHNNKWTDVVDHHHLFSLNEFVCVDFFFRFLIFLHFCHWSWWFFYSTFLSLFVYDFRCLLDVVHAVWWFQWKPFYINDTRIHTNKKKKKMWLITSFVRSFSCLLSRCYGKSQHLIFIKSLHTNC